MRNIFHLSNKQTNKQTSNYTRAINTCEIVVPVEEIIYVFDKLINSYIGMHL